MLKQFDSVLNVFQFQYWKCTEVTVANGNVTNVTVDLEIKTEKRICFVK